MSQEVTLQSVLEKSFSSQMDNVYTSIPAIVVRVKDNLARLAVDVQPTINILKNDGSITERAVILNVPVSMPVNKEGGITHPIKSGDTVMLLFSLAGIDLWKRSEGRPGAPSDFRKFDKKDCIALPIQTLPNSVNDPAKHTWTHSTDDVVMFHNVGTDREVEIRLKASGDVVVNTNQSINVYAGGDVNMDVGGNVNTTVSGTTTIDVTGDATVISPHTTIDSPLTTMTGNLRVEGGVSVGLDVITDLSVSLNLHQHIGNLGVPTSVPVPV